MSIFSPQIQTGLFGPCTDDGGTTQSLTFTRRATPITQDGSGEILVSFAALGTFTGDLQPDNGRFPRMVQGTLQQVNYDFFVLGSPDLRVGDRCTISGVLTEIIGTNVWGLEYVNCLLKEIR